MKHCTAAGPLVEEVPYPDDSACLFAPFAEDAYSIFLDSGVSHPQLGRYSFISADPTLVVRGKGERIDLTGASGAGRRRGNPFHFLRGLLEGQRLELPPGLPPFPGGLAGYFGYELAHFVEELPRRAADDLAVPDLYLGLYDWCLALDHLEQRAWLVCLPWRPDGKGLRREPAEERRRWALAKLAGRGGAGRGAPSFRVTSALECNSGLEDYMARVQRVREYISAGDIYQANISQRFELGVEGSPWELYRRLRSANPAPFAAYLNFPELQVLSASPERFLRLRGKTVETRPIKGTRPRGKTPAEDLSLSRELLSSIKDRAENVMIVDLLRNDIGRVCAVGSVRVPELTALESYATVHHLVSTVTGLLLPGKNAVDLLMACWPGGSITGAPKIRAMEIIDELEPVTRGVYCGSIGYISLAGDMDTSIVIRTIVVKDGRAYFQVGGGVVSDSDPEMEYVETLDKGKGLVLALEGGDSKWADWRSGSTAG